MQHLANVLTDEELRAIETNDCAVRALVATTGESYKNVWMALAYAGRKTGKGTTLNQMKAASLALGYVMVDYDCWKQQARNTSIRNVAPVLRGGAYICMTRGHVAGVVRGNNLDWTDGRRHRVKHVWQVQKM